MRRSQSTLLATFAVIAGLLFMSQFPALSTVSTVHPNETDGDAPPSTDSDGDLIPDVHETLFEEWMNWTTSDSRIVSIEGLDKNDGTDANSDRDRDGLNATEEYCWPFPANCTAPNFARGLTGVIDDDGTRTYLDPRMSDTDGDGMPDGYEVWMCEQYGGYNPWTMQFECPRFNPLDAEDSELDPDNDGFDINRDGTISVSERFTSPEEYAYGTPMNHTTEIDGLWCKSSLPDGAPFDNWPYIINGDNATFKNILIACAVRGESGIDTDLWLGTDPMREDSDRWEWTNFSNDKLYPSFGDNLPDGWEVHFGLNPLNRSDALNDPDYDGWDYNRDGVITMDPIRTRTGIKLGEEISNLEEYETFYDNGNYVIPGLKTSDLGESNSFSVLPLTMANPMANISINHYDIVEIITEANFVYVFTKYGITTIDYTTETSTHMMMPSGVVLSGAEKLANEDGIFAIAVASNMGVGIANVQVDGNIEPLGDWIWSAVGDITAISRLQITSETTHIIALGNFGVGAVVEVDTSGRIEATHQLSSNITQALSSVEANVTSVAHGSGGSSPLTLLVGTDRGLVSFETISARSDTEPNWHFFFALQSYDVTRNIDAVRPLSPGVVELPAYVRDITLDGPSSSDNTVAWLSMASGVHKFVMETGAISHSGLLAFPGIDGASVPEADNVHTIFPTGDELLIGSEYGLWAIAGDYAAVYGLQNQTRITGEIDNIAILNLDGDVSVLASADPGRYSNLELMHPGSNDSDNDGILDGWELAHGLDPTDPYDASLDPDTDGLNLDASSDGSNERLWTNLDEYRYVATSATGYNSTDPRIADTDNDGISDGAEYFGFFYDDTNLWCYYTFQMNYICDSDIGESANQTYLNLVGVDPATDPTNPDSDNDGMPDGWEIQNRRWIGAGFDGGNNWTLDPFRAEDANWDADNDGLANLCEYQWSLMVDQGISGNLLADFGESSEAANDWYRTDPNNIDSDGDGLPDGWEADGNCFWSSSQSGINPLNGSDYLNNPDGDGYDVNLDGEISPDEEFNNWLEYHIRYLEAGDEITFGNYALPEGFNTSLFDDITSFGNPTTQFVQSADATVMGLYPSTSAGAADPLNADTDDDGMPDGWEIYFARWDVFESSWTLNPLDRTDRFDDADQDGMTNWEEYNSISTLSNEIGNNRSAPRYFVTTLGNAFALQEWAGIQSELSFGDFMPESQYNLTGPTTDPNNVDTDGDGILDGMEVLFTSWNLSAQTWTLNPLVADDGDFDADEDGLIDSQEFALASSNPDNGVVHPSDAPLLHEDGDIQQPTEKASRIFDIIISKQTRGKRYLDDLNAWQQGEPPNAFISMMMGMTDPTDSDTDDDGMSDGFEYWFTGWDLDENRWSMNPLINNDVNLDSDEDSFDCNGDGTISLNETFSNLREWESRTWGKYLSRNSVPSNLGIVDFGEDAMNAYQDEGGMTFIQSRQALYNDFVTKGQSSLDRMNKINELDSDNFNRTLIGVADPTNSDSDGDGIPDGWEYCYATFGMDDITTQNRWASNPINPWDVNYDGDHDGWYNRTSFDTPAPLGTWVNRTFVPSSQVIQPGIGNLPFTNWMEYDNNTRPDLNDSDADSRSYITETLNGEVTAHYQDYNLTDGREVFKYGTNPSDNDTDGDMLPDWYEYAKAWNESNDNYSSYLQIEVVWIDPATGGACDTDTVSCRPLSLDNGILSRPDLTFTWFTMDPTDATDANFDPDQDGDWDCSGAGCSYTPYTNFQEFYAVTATEYASPNAVRLAGLVLDGQAIEEWWQFRAYLLGVGQWDESTRNYLMMDQQGGNDPKFAYIVNDMDTNYLEVNASDDMILVAGNRTDQWEIFYQSSPNTSPVREVGEHEFGWYMLDLDDDHVAEGSDPMNWDTDGDWLVDWFEVNDDEEDGVRGDSSPIRYDSRNTG